MVAEEYWFLTTRWADDKPRVFSGPDEIPAGSLFRGLARLTQEVVEVLAAGASNVRSTQEVVEVLAAGASNVQLTQLILEILQIPPKQVEDEYWLNWVAPVQAALYQPLPLGDPEELPAGYLLRSLSVWEEYWQNPAAPVAASVYRTPAFLDPDEYPHLSAQFAKVTQMVVEVMMQYQYSPYTGWTGVSMSVSS